MATSNPPSPPPPTAGGIQDKLMKHKFNLTITLFIAAIVVTLIYLAPRLVTILAYFWPLFLSTALFLATVVLFGKTSVPNAEASALDAGAGLLDYVAGENDHLLPNLESD
ncbi:hypothetical protein M5689_014465 [Euphorbia peplus]|nr:hypothetical protein M5689_014465 [Euphorbia peplus]